MLKTPVYCYKDECRRAPHSIHCQWAMEIDLLCLYGYKKGLKRGTAHSLILTWHQGATSTQMSIPSNQAEQILSWTGLQCSLQHHRTTGSLKGSQQREIHTDHHGTTYWANWMLLLTLLLRETTPWAAISSTPQHQQPAVAKFLSSYTNLTWCMFIFQF